MQLVAGCYDYKVTRNCNFSVLSDQNCQEICHYNHYDKFTQILTEIGVLIYIQGHSHVMWLDTYAPLQDCP